MSALQPQGLMVDLLAHPELTVINTATPAFSWVVRATHENAMQHGYRILVGSSRARLAAEETDLWDSGIPDFAKSWVAESASVCVPYDGQPLEAGRTYYWKVRVWTGPNDPSPWSQVQAFTLADDLEASVVSTYSPVVTRVAPREFVETEPGVVFIDFGRASFGTVELHLGDDAASTVEVHLGEVRRGQYEIEREPGGSRRYRSIDLKVDGPGTYKVVIPPDERNTDPFAIPVSNESFEVIPFRYCEIRGAGDLRPDHVRQLAVHYPFDDHAASFRSSSPVLDEVWDLCHHTMKATSFLGFYIDGDRERIPYEADAYITGLGHLSNDREFTMLRRSIDYLIDNPTWPTEWHLYLVIAAWNDFLYSGDDRLIRARYGDLRAKSLIDLRDNDGLVDTSLISPDLLEAIHFAGRSAEFYSHVGVRDVVDWPQVERDGHDFKPVNSVVNALHYRALGALASIADAIGKHDERQRLEALARQTREAFAAQLFSPTSGLVVDGVGSSHSSLHSNMFALACGVVPEAHLEAVVSFVRSKGMACSVYASHMLLEAAYATDDGSHALSLLTATGPRSWHHMIHSLESTITTEAWDDQIKPNQDWNHAWGAAPASIIPMYLLGVRPLEPGFARVLIDPKPGALSWSEGTVPTVRGAIGVRVWNERGSQFVVQVDVPANVRATVGVPAPPDGSTRLTVDGSPAFGSPRGGRLYVSDIGSGTHTIAV